MMPYEFHAIDRDEIKRWLRDNVQDNSLCLALEKIVDEQECKIARVSTKGHWIDTGWNEYLSLNILECSVCGRNSGTKTNYCPRCCAKMDDGD